MRYQNCTQRYRAVVQRRTGKLQALILHGKVARMLLVEMDVREQNSVWGSVMQLRKHNRNIVLAIASLILVTALPSFAAAQGRGRGRGHDKNWKCGVFVNCHDARDGRLDGRGPGSRIGQRNRDDDSIFRGRRARRVNRGNVIVMPRNRLIDRDGDGDFDRRDSLLGRRQNRWERLERRDARLSVRRNYLRHR